MMKLMGVLKGGLIIDEKSGQKVQNVDLELVDEKSREETP
jgi:hypothetical protein